MRVLVCGGRDFANVDRLYDEMDALHKKQPITVVIHGGARGADRYAGGWAVDRRVEVWGFPADWHKYGRGAGPIRNRQMLTEGKPDLVVAFPGGKGTESMVKQATEAGIPVKRIPARPGPSVAREEA